MPSLCRAARRAGAFPRPAKRLAFLALLGLAACAPARPDPATLSARYERLPIFRLWEVQGQPPSETDLMMVEAELGARGQMRFGGRHLGNISASAVGKPRFPRPGEPGMKRSCGEFTSPAAAQRVFLAAGGPERDTYGLDPDGDGFACAWGETLQQNRDKSDTTARRYQRNKNGYCYYNSGEDRIYVSRMFCA